MRKLMGTLLLLLPFTFILMIFLEGGMFGILIYLLYLFAASVSACSVLIGLLLLKKRTIK